MVRESEIRAGDEVVGTFKETGSAVKSDQAERRKVMALIDQGRSYRLIGREVGLSKNTVAAFLPALRGAGSASGLYISASTAISPVAT